MLSPRIEQHKKATFDYLSSAKGQFSWREVLEEEHQAGVGVMANNNPVESPFAAITRQLQSFGQVLGIHAAADSHTKMNSDFCRDLMDESNNGAFLKLTKEMHESLLMCTLQSAPEVWRATRDVLNYQHEALQEKQDILQQRKLVAA